MLMRMEEFDHQGTINIETVNEDFNLRGGSFDTWGGLWFFFVIDLFFFDSSLNVQFFRPYQKQTIFFSVVKRKTVFFTIYFI